MVRRVWQTMAMSPSPAAPVIFSMIPRETPKGIRLISGEPGKRALSYCSKHSFPRFGKD